MSLLKKFLKNSEGSLAIQLSVLILPLLGLIGAAVDYSRVAVVKTSLQATLDNNIRSMHHTAFRNRAEMEEYIVSMAAVNLDKSHYHTLNCFVHPCIHDNNTHNQ